MRNPLCEVEANRAGISAEAVIRLFGEQSHKTYGHSLFGTMREFICFAAMVGVSTDTCRPLTGKTVEIVDWRVFEKRDEAVDILHTIGIYHTHGTDILKPDREAELIKIFEEYINGGIDVIKDWIAKEPSDSYGIDIFMHGLRDKLGAIEGGKLNPENIEF